jgi:hypothetical protein
MGVSVPAVAVEFSEADYPGLFRAADAVSRSGQERHVWMARLELAFLTLAAIVGAVISVVPTISGQIGAVVVAVLLIGAAVVRSVARSTRPENRWFEGRAVAESVKTLAWKYMTHVEPYNGPDAEAEDQLTLSMQEVLGERLVLEPTALAELGGEQITAGMRRLRALGFEDRRTVYIAERVRDQLLWYSRRSGDHKRNADRWFVTGVVFEVLAIAAALSLIFNSRLINLIGVFSTVTAASTTLARLRGDSEVAQRYALAAEELAMIQLRIRSASETAFPERVIEAEAAISREHKMWAAKRL